MYPVFHIGPFQVSAYLRNILSALLFACGVLSSSNAMGDAPPLSTEEILATPANKEFSIAPNEIQIMTTGEVQQSNDGMTDPIHADIGVAQAYDTIPWCQEYVLDCQEMRVYIAPIPMGQPLKKTFESITTQSKETVQWTLLHGRAILSFLRTDKTASVDMLDREVRLESDASTLGSAMEALETAYNTQYKDVPVILSLISCLNSEPETPLSTPLIHVLPERVALRDAILRILDATGNYRASYGATIMRDPKDRPYVIVYVKREDCRDEFNSAEEFQALRAGAADERERLADYFAASEKK